MQRLEKEEATMKDDNGVGEQLEPQIWERLPNEVIEDVVMRIPFPLLVTYRVVCKQWNSFISNPPIQVDNPSLLGASLLPVLLYWGPQEVNNQSASGWIQTRSISGIESNSECKDRPASFPVPTPAEELHLMASEGGLLFFGCCDPTINIITDLLVCNPLLGQTKRLRLPPSPVLSMTNSMIESSTIESIFSMPFFLGVVVNQECRNYKVVIAGVDVRINPLRRSSSSLLYPARSCLVYDSITGIWKCCNPLPPEPKLSSVGTFRMIGRSVWCDGNLYWLAKYSPLDILRVPGIIFVFKYDLENDRWSRFETDFHSRKKNLQNILLYESRVSFCSVGPNFHGRVWGGCKFDVPILSYQSLDMVGRICDKGDDERVDQSLNYYMGFCFSHGNFCVQVSKGYTSGTTSSGALRRSDFPGFQITIQNTIENTHAHLKWETMGSGFFKDPEYVFAFSPSLTVLP